MGRRFHLEFQGFAGIPLAKGPYLVINHGALDDDPASTRGRGRKHRDRDKEGAREDATATCASAIQSSAQYSSPRTVVPVSLFRVHSAVASECAERSRKK
jgi:hypothetical protein